ncbi:MAG: 23S rRNA (adenine(2503)-C(2))-methyltransferase RlmN, partial [Aurantimicrobium sp.]
MTEKRGARNLTVRSDERPQVRPTAEGWKQNVDADGRPTLQFEQPKRGAKPPV